MGEIEERLLTIRDQEFTREKANQMDHTILVNGSVVITRTNYARWIKMVTYSILYLTCQAAGTLLVRLYYNEGGNSKWLETLLQTIGFPILIPLYYFSSLRNSGSSSLGAMKKEDQPSVVIRASLYLFFGVAMASTSIMVSVGLMYIPASTFALIMSTTQLASNTFFAFFLNSQKLTPLIINSLVLLIISSILLVPQSGLGLSLVVQVSEGKFVLGFICTVATAMLAGLQNNIVQLSFRRVLKSRSMKVIFELVMCELAVASCIITVCFLASGEWKSIGEEMDKFALGKVSYVMAIVWTAITWQMSTFGMTGLIFEVSSLFSNVIGILSMPIIPIVATLLFHEKMDLNKAISMILGIWGFISYVYQHYLDEKSLKMKQEEDNNRIPT